jgi:hypothetical protein
MCGSLYNQTTIFYLTVVFFIFSAAFVDLVNGRFILVTGVEVGFFLFTFVIPNYEALFTSQRCCENPNL